MRRVVLGLHACGLFHLRARRRGKALIVESVFVQDAVRYVRFKSPVVGLWQLEVCDNRGRWVTVGERCSLEDLIVVVASALSGTSLAMVKMLLQQSMANEPAAEPATIAADDAPSGMPPERPSLLRWQAAVAVSRDHR